MAYTKLLQPHDILKTATRLVEEDGADGLSLRAVASSLGVKAPSLYRYFPDKDALEKAICDAGLQILLTGMQQAAAVPDAEKKFKAMAEAYLCFARERPALYRFIMLRIPKLDGLPVSKTVWNLLLGAASSVSQQHDDTAAAVATWSLLHGYSLLEHSGAFGASGPKGGLELALAAFLNSFSSASKPTRKTFPKRATVGP